MVIVHPNALKWLIVPVIVTAGVAAPIAAGTFDNLAVDVHVLGAALYPTKVPWKFVKTAGELTKRPFAAVVISTEAALGYTIERPSAESVATIFGRNTDVKLLPTNMTP